MKKLIFLSVAFLFIVGWMSPSFVGTNPSGGGTPASGYYDPDGDISLGDWNIDGTPTESTAYEAVDDGIRSPTSVSEASYLTAAWDSRTLEMTMGEITGSVTTLRVCIYGWDNESTATLTAQPSANGTAWETGQTYDQPTAYGSADWTCNDFTVSWSGTTDHRLRLIRDVDGGFNNMRVWAVYAEANP